MKNARSLAILVGALVVLLPAQATAHAAPVPILGDLRCAVDQSQVLLDPPAIAGERLPDLPRPWLASRVTFSAAASACRGSSPTSPAPGGIDHGVLVAKARVRHRSCDNLGAMRPRFTIQWFDAGGARIATTHVATATTVTHPPFPSTDPTWWFTFTGTVRIRAKAFGSAPVSLTLKTDGNFISHVCSGDHLDSLPTLVGGMLTVGNPS
jgi:hypothetical protein